MLCPSLKLWRDRSTSSSLKSVDVSFYHAIVSKICVLANLVVSGNANDANITPLITELVSSFSTATTSVGAASLSRRHLKRDTVADVAVLLANIISVSDRRIWSLSTNVCKGYGGHS